MDFADAQIQFCPDLVTIMNTYAQAEVLPVPEGEKDHPSWDCKTHPNPPPLPCPTFDQWGPKQESHHKLSSCLW